MYDEFFAKAQELRSRGVPFATATVVRAEAPSSAKPGDKAIVTVDGVMHGWIGGSCAQPAVAEEAVRAIADGRCRLLRLSPEATGEEPRPGIVERPMTCYSGGTLEVHIEPQRPRPTLLVVGHLPVAQALAHLGRAMSYRVVAIDPVTGGGAMAHAEEVYADLEEIARQAGPLTYVVVATHGHFDEDALEQALAAPVPYVGLVSSRKRAASIRRQLEARGLDAEQLARLEAPAGLDIGASRGDEIALSIMAEIVQHLRSRPQLEWQARGVAEVETGGAGRERIADRETAIDPVCGMTVDVARARHIAEHGGVTYYFCGDGCRARFAGSPPAGPVRC